MKYQTERYRKRHHLKILPDLTGSEFHVYNIISKLYAYNNYKLFYLSQSDLIRRSGICKSYLMVVVKSLVRHGIVKRSYYHLVGNSKPFYLAGCYYSIPHLPFSIPK